MKKVWWSLNDTIVHLPTSLPSIKNEMRVIYYIPEYNKLRDKENVEESLIYLSGELSDQYSLLIQFYNSDKDKFDPGGGGVCADPVSTSNLCLSPVHHTPLLKRELEDAGSQGGIKV